MTTVDDVLAIRKPTDEQWESTKTVLELARAWERGDIDAEGVRTLCGGYDRNIAVRCLGAGTPDQTLVFGLINALIANETGYVMTEHGRFSVADLRGALARSITDRHGHRLWQFPYAFSAGGNPMYRDVPDYVEDEHQRTVEGT